MKIFDKASLTLVLMARKLLGVAVFAVLLSAETVWPQAAPLPLDQNQWTLHFVDSEELVGEGVANGAGIHSFDGDVNTFWHTQWLGSSPPPPHEIQINLGAVFDISGFRNLPRQGREETEEDRDLDEDRQAAAEGWEGALFLHDLGLLLAQALGILLVALLDLV